MESKCGVEILLVVAEPWDFESPIGKNVARYQCWPTIVDGERALVGSSDRQIIWNGESYQHMLFMERHSSELILLPIVGAIGVNAYALPRMTLDIEALRRRVRSSGPSVIGHIERPPECPTPSLAAVWLHHIRWAKAQCRRLCGACRRLKSRRDL